MLDFPAFFLHSPIVLRITLTSQKKIDLESRHNKARDAREYDRIKAVFLASEGRSTSSIAQALRRSAFNTNRHLHNEQIQQLIKHYSEYTDAHQVVAYISECWNIKYSVSGLNKLLYQQGFTYKKPKGVPRTFDSEKQAEYVEHYETLKASLPEDEVLLFMDAVHPTQATKITSGWIRKRVDKVINTTGSHTRLNIVGAIELDYLAAAIFDQCKTVNDETIIEFLQKVRDYLSCIIYINGGHSYDP